MTSGSSYVSAFRGFRRGGAFCATAALTALVLFVQPTLSDLSRGRLWLQAAAFAETVTLPHVHVGSTVATSTRWTADQVYVIDGSLYINNGVTLTIDPGVVVKSASTAALVSGSGALLCNGTEAQPVVFTSIKDDAHGGDTNNDGSASAPAKGDWRGILLENAASRLTATEVLYAGSSSSDGGVILRSSAVLDRVKVTHSGGYGIDVESGSPTITGCVLEDVTGIGVPIASGSPTLTGNVFEGAMPAAISISASAQPVLSGNTGSGWNHRIALASSRFASYRLTKEPIPYVIDGSLYINNGVTLTIDPGVVVKWACTTALVSGRGALLCNGTEAQPVVFTSIKDDAHGGDTNNDGSASAPAKGDWRGILLENAASRLTATEVLYAGSSSSDGGVILRSSAVLDRVKVTHSGGYGIDVESGSPTITGCVLEDVTGIGVPIASGSPTLTGNVFEGAMPAAISISASAQPVLSGNTGSGWNHRIALASSRFASYRLTKEPIPYVIDGSLYINNGVTLTIDPGVVVKWACTTALVSGRGALLCNGTEAQPVVFTSIKDDAHGGDTNNDGSASAPAKGDWRGILLENAASRLTATEVLYAGSSSSDGGVILRSSAVLDRVKVTHSGGYGIDVESGSPTITGCVLEDVTGIGVPIASGSPTLTGNVFEGAMPAAISISASAQPVLSGNTGSGWNHRIALASSRFASYRLTKEPIPYVIDGSLYINNGVTLTIDPGVVVKWACTTALVSGRGALLCNGTEAQPVVFTSIKDDAHGGDTNNDGSASAPAKGDWRGILLENAASRLTATEVLYAGSSSSDGGVILRSSAVLDRVKVTHSGGYGIDVESGSPTITGCVVAGNAGTGAHISGGSPILNWNNIYNNGSGGLVNLYTPVGSGIDARYNYWGRTSGPREVEKANAQCEPWLQYPIDTPESAQVLGGNTPCGIWGEPVNTSTGNFYYSASDLVLPGVGPEISVGRTYNHQDASSRGVLGYGWTLDCESFVQPQSDGSALVVYPGGARKTFTPDGSGGYIAPQGALEVLATTATGGWTLTSPDRTVNTYGATGTLLTVADRYGNMVIYTRNALGAITRIEGTGGRYVVFTYTGDLLTRVTDNAGRQVTYTYSAAGDLATVTDVTGAVTTYTSDAQHRVTQVASAEHPADPFVSHGYDAANRVAVQYDGYGNVGTLSYAEGVTTITNNRGFTELHQFDDEFRLTAETDGAGNTSTRSYNAAGLVETLTDANNHTTSFTYDANGNRTSATDAAGHTTRAAYDLANNNILWSEDAEGVRTTYAYDATGAYLERVTNPVFETVYGHYANGLVESVTLAGATTHYAYDTAGRLTSVTDPLGAESTLAYNAAGNLTSTTDAMGRSASFTYDAAGRVLTATDPAGETASFSYDLNGNRTSATDQLGKTTHFTYDVLDKLAGVTDPLANSWAYTYDPNYNLSSVTNPRGATTSYTYSANDLLTATTDALGHTWAFTHDAAGNTLSSSYPTGETVSRTYTADDLLAQSAYSTGESYAFTYTPAHRLSGVTDQAGRTQSFDYNPVGWLLSATDTAGGNTFATTYAYDEAGRVTSLDSDAAQPVTYAYDLAGRLASMTSSGATATFTHDAAGARTGVTLPNGALTAFGYDAAGRIASIVTTATSGVIAERYARDAAGRVTADSSGTYAYDDAGRLVTWTAPTGAVTTYTYDAASNFTGASTDGSATASFEVDAADRITSPGFTYDAAGNLTSDGDRTFTYDAACRLVAVADASTETTIATFTYDAFNRRVSSTEGTATVFFHYDGASPRVIAETDGSGAVLATYTYDSAGALFSMSRGGATYFYHTNARGDVVAMSDSSGAVVNTYTYDPWGTLLSADEAVPNPYRYASYRYDASTGLSYCWNRYYAPELARFLTRDIYPGELPDPVTMNPYLYCGGDPVNAVDPSGMSWVPDFVGDAWDTWNDWITGLVVNHAPGIVDGLADAMTAMDLYGVAEPYVKAVVTVNECERVTRDEREAANAIRAELAAQAEDPNVDQAQLALEEAYAARELGVLTHKAGVESLHEAGDHLSP